MKKLLIMIGVIIVLLGAVFFAMNSGKPDENEIFRFINGQQFQERIENKDDFVVYVYGERCVYCREFAPTIEGYLREKGYTIDKLEAQTDQENYKIVVEELGDKMQGTPAVYVFKDGKVEDYMVGNQTPEVFEGFAGKNDVYFSTTNN